jgi:CubicO group peptidase (beta-lactamase class C family)/pimeloyl-ACP methyl ester carboxylesterase
MHKIKKTTGKISNNAKSIGAIFLFFILGSVPLLATKDVASKADDYLSAHAKLNRFSGSVLIAQKGEVLLKKSYGMANYEHRVPNTPQTKFRIASLTKQFTAMAILQLQEKGMLNVKDPLSKYIPDYPNGENITIHHLLTHTSGVPNFTVATDDKARLYPIKLEKTIDKVKNLPLNFSPGEKFEYSNAGYYLLGFIIEKATGKSYASIIQENIFEPLGMTNSGYDCNHIVLNNRAAGYNLKNDQLVNARYIHMANVHASGGLYSTVEDLYTWDRALGAETLIKHKSLEQMFAPHTKNYGYGWGVVTLFNRKMAGHNGDMDGFQTNITRFIDDDVCILLLSNFGHAPIGKISVDLAAIVFGEEYQIPGQKGAKINPEILDDYVGQYEINPKFKFVITREDNRLFCQPTGQKKLELIPESETKFSVKDVGAKIEFARDEDGKVRKLILHQSGREVPAKKIKREPVERLVKVGDYSLNFKVIKGNNLTVLLEAGGGMDSKEWDKLAPVFAQETGATVVSYDRAGFGKSDLPETPYSMREELGWLWKGLEQLGLNKNLVLMGHSYGGWLIRLIASEYPDAIKGMVFVDPFTNEFVESFGIEYLDNHPMTGKNPFEKTPPEKLNRQQRALIRMIGKGLGPKIALMRKTTIPSGIPVRVITCGKRFLPKPEEHQAWRKAHEDFTASIEGAVLLIAEQSAHMIPWEQPEIIIKALREIIALIE